MVARITAFLACVFLLAWVIFQILVDGEVKRVVVVHAMDKASHLVDMFEANPHTAPSFANGTFERSDYAAFIAMAEAIHVTSIYFLDPTGENIGRLNKIDAPAPAPKPAANHAEDGHHGITDHAPEAEDAPHMNHARHDAPSHANGHDDGASHAHDHGATDHDPLADELLSTTPLPSADNLRFLIAAQSESLISVETIKTRDEKPISYANVVLPVRSNAGEALGFIGFVMNVSHIHLVYAKGVATFGMLFMACGIVLFGVPSLAFWLQKRLVERSSQDAKYLSRHDALTGLLNRSAFVGEAQAWMEQDRVGYVAFIDGDRFKLINDTYGHSVGDAFLRHLAKLLETKCGEQGLVARFGGDEFTLILPKLPEDNARLIIDTLMKTAMEDVEIDGFNISGSISIGIAQPKLDETFDQTLQRADTALYYAKSGGRQMAAFYTEEMGTAARRRRLLESRLREACRNEEFQVHYQPLVDARSSGTLGYEALLRLDESNGTPISPDEFIPIAEEIGLIEDIGTWVLNQATKQISDFDDHSRVSINLSAEQFRSGNLVGLVSSALEQSGLPAHRLELEITESLLLDHDTSVGLQIDALKDMGASIAMDDFGTGFSSLSTLWRHGFDRIKIDKSFVQALDETSEKSQRLIDAIILLGTRMGMSITAEGVETEDQRNILTSMGCNVLQGYLFGRPQPLNLLDAPLIQKTAS